MQLILDSEPALAIERNMSAIDDVHNEKVGNGDTEKLNGNNCNGNKENIAEDNIITNDEVHKQVVNTEVEASTDSANETKSDKAEVDGSTGDVIKEETRESNIPEVTDEKKEESPTNGISIEAEITDNINNESDKKAEKILDEIVEEADVVSIKGENLDKTLGVLGKDSETVANSDAMTVKDDLPGAEENIEIVEQPVKTQVECDAVDLPSAKDDIEIVEEPVETHKECETPLDKVLEIQANTPENKEKQLDDSNNVNAIPDCDPTQDDMDVEEVVETTDTEEVAVLKPEDTPTAPASTNNVNKPIIICKLSNTLDILSDDEDEAPREEPPQVMDANEKQCINIEDDDDIMLIDEDTNKTEKPQNVDISNKEETPISVNDDKTNAETGEKGSEETVDLFAKTEDKELPKTLEDECDSIKINEKQEDHEIPKIKSDAPLLPENFFKTAKKNLSDMTREELEEFCILKIVESIVDRSNLSEIKNRLKTVTQGIEEYRKKAMMLSKQNRDLQVVLKSIQEEQKKVTDTPITPLKITRSVGMQVFMEKTGARRKNLTQSQTPNNNSATNKQNVKTPGVSATNTRVPKAPAATQAIPVPRLVPANNNPGMKSPSTIPMVNQITPAKAATPIPNGVKAPSPAQKVAEKRQHNRIMSVTVDLTDDEPPTKVNNRNSPAPPVRVVPSQNLMASPRQPFASTSPRKVYIPISGPQNQGLRPGQTIMLKPVPAPGLRPRGPTPPVARAPTGAIRMNRVQTGRHPAPLPDVMKQYQPPNWKALPPAPDLKLSKVENGIVISWKIEGYQEDSYEEIASYQLYAYQETSSPPSTALWKKIGDVKALPLPMACTLTQFMAGFKYYFAVRAVDIRSRLGPFSLPGSILLLNKL